MTPGPSIDAADLPDTFRVAALEGEEDGGTLERGAPRIRARVPAREAARARLEHLAHRRGDRHRAREPLAQDQDPQDRNRAWLASAATAARAASRRRARRAPQAAPRRRARAQASGVPRGLPAVRADAEVLENRAEGGENQRLRLRGAGLARLPARPVRDALARGAHRRWSAATRCCRARWRSTGPAREPGGAEVEILLQARRARHAAAGRDAAGAGAAAGRPARTPLPGARSRRAGAARRRRHRDRVGLRARRPGPAARAAPRCCSARAARPT